MMMSSSSDMFIDNVVSNDYPGYSGGTWSQNQSNNSSIEEQDYDYDLDESFSSFDWTELGPSITVYSITFLLGVFGNILILVAVIRHTHVKNSPVNVFLASLALGDLLLILICLPLKVAKLFSYTWTMGVFSCKMLYYMESVSSICSVLNLTALSIERYYAIVHPLKAQYLCTISKAKKTVLVTWTSAFILATPILWVQVHKEVGFRIKAYWCVRDFDSLWWWRLGELYLLFVVLICPAIVMIFSYGRIIFEVCKVFRQREKMTNGATPRNAGQGKIQAGVRYCNQQKMDQPLNKKGTSRNTDLERNSNCMVPLNAPVMTVTDANGVYEIALEEETCAMLQQHHREQQEKHLIHGKDDEDNKIEEESQRSDPDVVRVHSRPQEGPTSQNSTSRSSDTTSRQVSPCPRHEDAAKLNGEPRKEVKKLDEETKQVVRMLISIVILFVVCWAPILVFNVLQSFSIIDFYLIGTIKYAKTTFSLMAYFNSCINPLVYGFMSKNFRESFLSDIRTCCQLGRRRTTNRRNSRYLQSANSGYHASQAMSTVKNRSQSVVIGRDRLLPMTSRGHSTTLMTMTCDDGNTGVSMITSTSFCNKSRRKSGN